MRLPQGRFTVPILFWWLYAFLGACCLFAGLYLFYINHLLGKLPYQAMGPIAIILVLFGPIRIANSARMIYNLHKRARIISPSPVFSTAPGDEPGCSGKSGRGPW